MCIEVKNLEIFPERKQYAMSPGNLLYLARKLISIICLSKRSQKHERMRQITGTESYFEIFLHMIQGIFSGTQKKLMSA